nr:Bax inhibitor-1/YccA family protein [uncultured Flavobacterium sp.]
METKSRNPFLTDKAFKNSKTSVYDANGNPVNVIDRNDIMTINGTINKTFILFALLFAGALVPFFMQAAGLNPLPGAIASAIVALVMVFGASFAPKYSAYLAPGYALFEGVFISTVSILFEAKYNGIVSQAVMATLITFGVALALYRFRIIRVTERFKSIIITAMFAVISYYLIAFLFSFFGGIQPFHVGNSIASIGFSIFLVGLAAANLLLDFNFIEEGAQRGLPKYMEWYSGMGLLVTLVWLYMEILRLLSKIQSRN